MTLFNTLNSLAPYSHFVVDNVLRKIYHWELVGVKLIYETEPFEDDTYYSFKWEGFAKCYGQHTAYTYIPAKDFDAYMYDTTQVCSEFDNPIGLERFGF